MLLKNLPDRYTCDYATLAKENTVFTQLARNV